MAGKMSFDIVLKLAERCNLACSYCYYFQQEFDTAASPPLLLPEVAEALPAFLSRAAQDTRITRFNIVFHGGEPLLARRSRVDELCTRIRAALHGRAEVSFALQTNGALIDEAWIALFAKHDIMVGISIDGLKADHDRLRPDKSGKGSYDRAVAGLALLRRAVAEGRLKGAGALAFPPDHVCGEEFLESLVVGLGIRNLGLNLPRGGWDNPEAAAWGSNVEGRRELVRAWLRNHVVPNLALIPPFSDLLLALISDRGARILDDMNSRRHHVLTISSRGEMLPDDNLLGLDGRLSDQPKTIFEATFVDFLRSHSFQELLEAVDTAPMVCAQCVWNRTCRSGNLYNRYSRSEGFRRSSVLCESIKVFHEEISSFAVAHRLVTPEALTERLEAPPTTSAAEAFHQIFRADDDPAPSKRMEAAT